MGLPIKFAAVFGGFRPPSWGEVVNPSVNGRRYRPSGAAAIDTAGELWILAWDLKAPLPDGGYMLSWMLAPWTTDA